MAKVYINGKMAYLKSTKAVLSKMKSKAKDSFCVETVAPGKASLTLTKISQSPMQNVSRLRRCLGAIY